MIKSIVPRNDRSKGTMKKDRSEGTMKKNRSEETFLWNDEKINCSKWNDDRKIVP